MNILQKEVSGENRYYLKMGDEEILLSSRSTDSDYYGTLSPGQTLSLDSFLTVIFSDDLPVPQGFIIPELTLRLNRDGDLISFFIHIREASGDEEIQPQTFSFEAMLRLLGIAADFSVLPVLPVQIQSMGFDRTRQEYSIHGTVATADSSGEVECKIQTPDEEVALDFHYRAAADKSLSVRGLVEHLLPESLYALLPPTGQQKDHMLLDNLLTSGLTELHYISNPATGNVSFLASGVIFGFRGEIWFAITKMIDEQLVSFHLYGDEETNLKSLPQICTELLGLEIGQVEEYLPRMQFALTEFSFDQLEECFRLQGVIASQAAQERDGYRMEGSLQVEWRDGIRIGAELNAAEHPLTFAELQKDLPFSLQGLEQVIPQELADQINATELYRWKTLVDTGNQIITMEGMANLFGKFAASGSFTISKEAGLQFDTEIYASPLSIGDLLELIHLPVDRGLIPNLKVGLRKLSFDQSRRRFIIGGLLATQTSQAELELSLQLVTSHTLECSLRYHSPEEAALTWGDLVVNLFPPAFCALLPAGEGGAENVLLQNLKASALYDLQFDLNPAAREVSLFASGRIMGLTGEISFSVTSLGEQKAVSFEIKGNESTNLRSIPNGLKEIFGIQLSEEVIPYIPKMEFALMELTFNQLEERFCCKGLIAKEGVSGGGEGYRLYGGLEVEWVNGFRLKLELDASKGPLTLKALEKELPFSLDALAGIVPAAIVENIGATAFHHCSIALDTAEKCFEIEGAADLFGKLLMSASFRITLIESTPVVRFTAVSKARPRNLPEMLRDFIGLDLPEDTVKYLPAVQLALEELTFDQEEKKFVLAGIIAGQTDGTPYSVQTELDLSWKNGLDFRFRFVSEEETPFTLTALIEAFPLLAELLKNGSPMAGIMQKIGSTVIYRLDVHYDQAAKQFTFHGEVNPCGELRVVMRLQIGGDSLKGSIETPDGLQITDVLEWLGVQGFTLPTVINPGLTQVIFSYTSQEFVFTAQTNTGHRMVFVMKEQEGKWGCVVGMDYDSDRASDGEELEELVSKARSVGLKRVCVIYSSLELSHFVLPVLPETAAANEGSGEEEAFPVLSGKTLDIQKGMYLLASLENVVLPQVGIFELDIRQFYIRIIKENTLSATAHARLELTTSLKKETVLTEISLDAKYSGAEASLDFSGNLRFTPQLKVNDLFGELFHLDLPEEIPSVAVKSIGLDISTQGTFKLQIEGSADTKLLFGPAELDMTTITFGCERQKSGISASVKVKGDGQFAEDFRFSEYEFSFAYTSGRWELHGNAGVSIFGLEPVTIQAAYEEKEGNRDFSFIYQGNDTLPTITIPSVAAFAMTGFEISVRRKSKETRWGFSASGNFAVYHPITGDPVFVIEKGVLKKPEDQTGLTFTAEKACWTIFTIPYEEVTAIEQKDGRFGEQTTIAKQFSAGIRFNELSIAKTPDWTFQGSVNFIFTGLPAPLNRIIDEKGYTATCRVDNRRLKMEISGGFEALEIPDFTEQLQDAGGQMLLPPVGYSAVKLSKISLELEQDIQFAVELGLGLPSKLNEFFGLDRLEILGHRGFPLFKTCRKNAQGKILDEDLVEVRLCLGSKGVSGGIHNLPFRDLREVVPADLMPEIKEEKDWIHVDLTPSPEVRKKIDLGCFSIEKPKFALDLKKGALSIAAAYKIDAERGMQIPLSPIAELMRRFGFAEAADKIPSGIPVGTVDLTRWENDRRVLNLEAFKEIVGWFNLPIPNEFWIPLDVLKHIVDDLPERFKEYLRITVPQSLSFQLDITGDGGVSLDIATDAQNPLQILGPLSLPQPVLTGIRLRRLAFGTLLGGSLLKLEIDMEIDQFDLFSLAAAIALDELQSELSKLPPELRKMLPEPGRFQQTVFIEDLLILIIYETEIPIPVPLFCKRLELRDVTIEGSELITAVYFPKPTLNAMKALKIVGELKDFFMNGKDLTISQRPVELDEAETYQKEAGETATDLNLVFSAGPFFLRLPKFLGTQLTEVWQLKQASVETVRQYVQIPETELRRLLGQRYYSEGMFWKALLSLDGVDAAAVRPYRAAICALAQDQKELGSGIGLFDRYQLLNVLDLIAIIANTVKRGSINYLIQSLHLKHRIGIEQFSLLGIFHLDAAWVVSTPGEFEEAYAKLTKRYSHPKEYFTDEFTEAAARLKAKFSRPEEGELYQKAYAKLQARYAERLKDTTGYPTIQHQTPAQELLSLLAEHDDGRSPGVNDEGIALFLRGGLQITDLVVFETALGLTLNGVDGFRTGVSLYAYLAGLVEMRCMGFIKISPDSSTDPFHLLGKSSLTVFRRRVMEGIFELTGEHLLISGSLDLFPAAWPLQLKGHLDGYIAQNEVYLDSEASLELGMIKARAAVLLQAKGRDIRLKADILYVLWELHVEYQHSLEPVSGFLLFDLRFRGFELVNFASRLKVAYNVQSGITLAGMTSLTIGTPSLLIARIETDLRGSLDFANGFLGVQSTLAPGSYLLGEGCQITGGFAFYTWFGGGHMGDFVLTIGGYHPQFHPPAHYPAIPRVGLHWQIDSYTSIAGDGYFALTPSTVMTGGYLTLNYQLGRIRAWFSVQADFIAEWKPFSYAANAKAVIGIAYQGLFRTYSAELGVNVELWGPPLGGQVLVQWWIISFTIGFGPGRPAQKGIDWSEFRQLLPSDDQLCMLIPDDGVTGVTAGDDIWMIHPDEWEFSIKTAVPSQTIFLNDHRVASRQNQIGIRPLRRKDVSSEMRVMIVNEKQQMIDLSDWEVKETAGSGPDALWGNFENTDLNRTAVIGDLLLGLRLAPPRAKMTGVIGPIGIKEHLSMNPVELGVLPLSHEPVTSQPFRPHAAEDSHARMTACIQSQAKEARRTELFGFLRQAGLYHGSNDSLVNWSQNDFAMMVSPLLTEEAGVSKTLKEKKDV